MTDKRGLMKRQEIYNFIVDYIQKHGYAPTIREIGEAVNLKSTSTVHMHMTKMFTKGILESDVDIEAGGGCSARAYRVVGYKWVKE